MGNVLVCGQMPSRVDFVVPVYNEKENFSNTYKLIQEYVQSDWHMYVVYDFPQDSTLESARPIAEKDPRVTLLQNTTRGALAALKVGFAAAKADAVLPLMADDPPEVIQKIDLLVRTLYEQNASIVVASRYMKGGAHIGGPWFKAFLSRMASVTLRMLVRLPTHDATYATRLYRKSFLDSIQMESKEGFEYTLELTIKAFLRGEKIVEIPVVWHDRTIGTSQFQLRAWLTSYLHWYFYAIRQYYFPSKNEKSIDR